jgi:integrase
MTTAKRVILTDLLLKNVEPAEPGKRTTIWDATRPAFGCRVTDRGVVSFFVMRRLLGKRQPVRVGLGTYPRVSLAEARKKAAAALAALGEGVHPRERERELQQAAERQRGHTFGALAERYLTKHAAKQKRPKVIAQIVARLVEQWGSRPVSEIKRADVVAMIEDVNQNRGRDSAIQAHTYAASVFQYGCEVGFGGLEANPCRVVKVAKIVGEPKARQRVLTDDEVAAVWRAADAEAYPLGPFVKLLLLTGARRSEVAQMTWDELDLDAGTWSLTGARTKTGVGEVKALSGMAVELLRSLPRQSGPHVLSASKGRRPISAFGQFKDRIDALCPGVKSWRLHDLRRTMRTNLGPLKVSPFVAELCLGHAQKGVATVYDLFTYIPEKREAMEKWAAHVREVVGERPPPGLKLVSSAR